MEKNVAFSYSSRFFIRETVSSPISPRVPPISAIKCSLKKNLCEDLVALSYWPCYSATSVTSTHSVAPRPKSTAGVAISATEPVCQKKIPIGNIEPTPIPYISRHPFLSPSASSPHPLFAASPSPSQSYTKKSGDSLGANQPNFFCSIKHSSYKPLAPWYSHKYEVSSRVGCGAGGLLGQGGMSRRNTTLRVQVPF